MGYLSVSEAAARLGLSQRRVQQMCREGEISGAVREGRRWMVQEESVSGREKSEQRKSLPVGISDFRNAVTNYCYVDKTLLIRDFLNKRVQVSLFTRPRRFGKTLNMDMLRVFFEMSETDTSIYFQNLAIWGCGEKYRAEQGKYPVIFLSFKDVKQDTYEKALQNIASLLSAEFDRHRYLLDSEKCSPTEKKYFRKITAMEADEVAMGEALKYLSHMLCVHHGVPAVIMVDEYDTPIQEGYFSGYYDRIVAFIRNLFSGGFKDNSNLSFGFLTGILRVAKESIFSGMNNLKVYSVTDELYSEYFGFTENEVRQLLEYYGGTDHFYELRSWYDGYRFGSCEIYNPWSVTNYIDDDFQPKAFWQSTGSNEIIGEILSAATAEIMKNLLKLMQGESIVTYIDGSVIYPEIKSRPYSIYSFLVMTGYLRVVESHMQDDGALMCSVSIPNREIAYVYDKEIISRNPVGFSESSAVEIREAIYKKDMPRVQKLLEQYLIQTISYFDAEKESFYHGMMIGLCAILNNRYYVTSNREEGLGRFDIQLEPRTAELPGFILEIKATGKSNEDLHTLAKKALAQINKNRYAAGMTARGIKDIIKLGVAFRGKQAVVLAEE